MANPARELAWQRRLSPAPSVGCRFAPAGEGPCSSLWARGDDSEQLKWLYVLSSSTVALAAAAAEWKKQENMCINLKNLNLLGSYSLVRRLVPVPVLLRVHTSHTTPTATPATSCDLWAQLLYIFLSFCGCCCSASSSSFSTFSSRSTSGLQAMLHHRRGCFLWLSLCYLFSAMARPLTGELKLKLRLATGAGYLPDCLTVDWMWLLMSSFAFAFSFAFDFHFELAVSAFGC